MAMRDRQAADRRTVIADRVSAMDWNRVIADVSPFLERSKEIELMTRENVLSLLRAS